MAWHDGEQVWLSEKQSLENAQLVANHFKGTDWTKESISALCGNMRHESSINPNMYEYGYDWSANRGYGLVQWTPRSKYWDWAVSEGLSPRSGDSQLARIDYEVDHNIQWIAVDRIENLTFKQFRTNSRGWSVEKLTEAFTWGYERPNESAGQESMPDRKAFARKCLETLDWTGTGGGGGGYQLAQFPMDMIYVTQGENGSFSHQGTLAIDFVGTTDKYPYYAPCDCTAVATGDAYLVWTSDKEVMCADGTVRYITFINIHEEPLIHSVGTKLKKGELMGHTGIGGRVTGDHWHFNVIDGNKYTGWEYKPGSALAGTELHIYDVFAVNGVKIVEGYGYPWKTSDWKDGDGSGGTQPGDEKKKKASDLIHLLLAGTLKGWT